MNITDKPKAWECPGCGAQTLSAWRDGLYEQVHADPVSLTPLGELQALAAGRGTFCHWGGPNGGLDTRRADDITARPAGSTHDPIRPEHRCGSPPLDARPSHLTLPPDAPPPF